MRVLLVHSLSLPCSGEGRRERMAAFQQRCEKSLMLSPDRMYLPSPCSYQCSKVSSPSCCWAGGVAALVILRPCSLCFVQTPLADTLQPAHPGSDSRLTIPSLPAQRPALAPFPATVLLLLPSPESREYFPMLDSLRNQPLLA